MSGFDTSGVVRVPRGKTGMLAPTRVSWSDLNPFTQGYVEALLTDLLRPMKPPGHTLPFRVLAPETLARIMADCAKGVEIPYLLGRAYSANAAGGARFWADRQSDIMVRFKPLTPYLDDDGKVYLRDAPSPSSDREGS